MGLFAHVRTYGDCRNNIGDDCGMIPQFKAWVGNNNGGGNEHILYPCPYISPDCGNYIPPIDGNQQGWMNSSFEMEWGDEIDPNNSYPCNCEDPGIIIINDSECNFIFTGYGLSSFYMCGLYSQGGR